MYTTPLIYRVSPLHAPKAHITVVHTAAYGKAYDHAQAARPTHFQAIPLHPNARTDSGR